MKANILSAPPHRGWIALVAGLLLPLVAAAGTAKPDGARWVAAWVSAQQLVEPGNLPPPPALAGNSLRQVIQPAVDGDRVRVAFSNQFGDQPLVIAAAHIAYSRGGAAIDRATDRALRFAGEPGITIPPGASMMSDPVGLEVKALANLAVTVHCTAVPRELTGHPGSRTTSYLTAGDATAAPEMPQAVPTDHWYLLASVEVQAAPTAATVVVVGDSITDGRGSTTNANDRWPNQLVRRLRADPHTAGVGVLNQGIGGNRVLHRGLGPSALERFDRDVLAPPGVRWVIIFEGVNDLGTAVAARAHGQPAVTARDLIVAFEQMIERAHSHGLKVYGATIMPFAGFTAYFTVESEADRQAVNQWIRTSGRFDGVIDFDAMTRDPEAPKRLRSTVDGGDHLHPSAAGYKLMADGIDLSLFAPAP